MSKPTTFLSIIILFVGCELLDTSNTTDNNLELDPFIVENYSYDAKQLYLHEIYYDNTHPNYNNPELDTTEVRNILEIIQAVYNLDIPERDTVFHGHGIHVGPGYGFAVNSITMKVDTDAPEIESMVKMNIPTGNEELDDLLISFGFDSVRTSYGYPNSNWLTLYTDNDYNMIPIADRFERTPSVLTTEISPFSLDGHTIYLDRQNENKSTIIFSAGFGDCPSGCFFHFNWKFEVEDNRASFVKRFKTQG